MFNKYRLRYFTFPCLFAVLSVVGLSTLIYGVVTYFNIHALPTWLLLVAIPCIFSWIALSILSPGISKHLIFRVTGSPALHKLGLYILIAGISTALISFSSKSMLYNVARTVYVTSVNDLQAHEQPYFLEMGDWYVDRMRVIPLNLYETEGIFTKNVKLTSLFVMPIFSRNTAYRTKSRAWLAVDYEKRISATEFKVTQGRDFYEESLSHFKKINVREYLYLEQYPKNRFYRIYLNVIRTHSYFQSGYAYVYKGQNIHRDTLSLYYAMLFFVFFGIGCCPLLLLFSLGVHRMNNNLIEETQFRPL